MISSKNERVTITLPKEIAESIEKVAKSFKTTKSILIQEIFIQWIIFQNDEIEKALKRTIQIGKEKPDA